MKFHISHPKEIFDPLCKSPVILTGNEAFARGLFEANAQFLATYPGTPTSEIGDLWEYYAQDEPDVFYDLAVNETVAFEASVGAAWTGIRSAVSFKHLGMNLISDALHSVMYSGIDGDRHGGLVILCGGDPDITSSTNAQDVRLFSYHSQLPILEPSTIQECKDFVAFAFHLSEVINLPVMVYTTSRLNHASGIVSLNPSKSDLKNHNSRHFVKNFDKFLNAIHWAQKNQRRLFSIISDLQKGSYDEQMSSPLYEIRGKDTEKLTRVLMPDELKHSKVMDNLNSQLTVGFIGSGLGWSYIEELVDSLSIDCPRLRLKMSFPFPIQSLSQFLTQFHIDIIIIVEDQEAFLEKEIKGFLYDQQISIPIIGKRIFPRVGSLSPQIIVEKLAQPLKIAANSFYFLEFKTLYEKFESGSINHGFQPPIREPTFCPGCSHRNVFYSLRKAGEIYQKKTGITPIFGGDIGCYTMSMSEPYKTMDWLICMGAGVGIANGVAQSINSEKQHLIAMIGDSTFFHSGIPAIINLIKQNANVLVLILDNYYTAMTGHQLSPSTPEILQPNINLASNTQISILSIIKSLGDHEIQIMDGYSNRIMQNQFLNLFSKPGVKFAIVKAECALQKSRRIHKLGNLLPKQEDVYYTITENCVKCDECFQKLGCTAIQMHDNMYYIDNSRCFGENCGSCVAICPNSAIQITRVHHFSEERNPKPHGEKD